MKELQSSLFVNIMPIFTDRMASIEDRSGTIPVRDFCGIDISLNAKLLLIATSAPCTRSPKTRVSSGGTTSCE